LLRHAEGTVHASFVDELVESLTGLATSYARRAYPSVKMTAARRRTLVRVYQAFVASIASILREETTERLLAEATAHFATFHLAGLAAFFHAAERMDAKEDS
jgi:hypothetical protein